VVRWLKPKSEELAKDPKARPELPRESIFARDSLGNLVALLPSAWATQYFQERNAEWLMQNKPF
jgi:hypothetical protein